MSPVETVWWAYKIKIFCWKKLDWSIKINIKTWNGLIFVNFLTDFVKLGVFEKVWKLKNI